MKKTCDMHIHSDFSDGILSADELIEYIKKHNLKKFSVTDHDCVDFYLLPDIDNKLKGLSYIAGCEFVAGYKDVAIEILGYGFDIEKVKKYLDKHGVTQNKIDRFRGKQVVKLFSRMGINLDFDIKKVDFSLRNPMVLHALFDSILRNEQAVRLLNEENPNLIKNRSFLLREGFNNPKSKFFIKPTKIYPNYKRIIKIIKKFGGLSFLAHPYQYRNEMLRVLEGIKEEIDGIECYHHTTVDEEKKNVLIDYCKANNLLISGGSDFHNPPNNQRCIDLNELNIPEKYFDIIQQRTNVD